MAGIDVNSLLSVSRALPVGSGDGTTPTSNIRGGRYREQHVLPMYQNNYCYADEGSYFVFTNPTVSTGIAFGAAAQTTFSDTAAGLAIINNDSPSALGKRVYLDYIKLICTTAIAGTITTPFYQMAGKLDTVASRYASGGTPQVLGVNAGGGSTGASISKMFFGVVTLNASTSAGRLLFRNPIRGVAGTPAVNDIIVIKFGAVEAPVGGAQNIAAAAPVSLLFNAPPVVLDPGNVFSLHAWATAQTGAPVYEFEIGLWER